MGRLLLLEEGPNIPQWLFLILGKLEVYKMNNVVINWILTPEGAFLNLLRYCFTGIILACNGLSCT